MADTRPTKLSFPKAVWLCFLLLFAPSRFGVAEQEDNTARADFKEPPEPEHRSQHVRRAFFKSFMLVVASAATGCISGALLQFTSFSCAPPKTVGWLQIVGACILLWGTLFVRGWEIQTYCGVTLTERVNQWLYRFLYFSGTAMLVFSLAWPACQA